LGCAFVSCLPSWLPDPLFPSFFHCPPLPLIESSSTCSFVAPYTKKHATSPLLSFHSWSRPGTPNFLFQMPTLKFPPPSFNVLPFKFPPGLHCRVPLRLMSRVLFLVSSWLTVSRGRPAKLVVFFLLQPFLSLPFPTVFVLCLSSGSPVGLGITPAFRRHAFLCRFGPLLYHRCPFFVPKHPPFPQGRKRYPWPHGFSPCWGTGHACRVLDTPQR